MRMKKLSIAYTPDSDDVFNYYAWEKGRISTGPEGYEPSFHKNHIIDLNRDALEERFDVVAVSSVFYPLVADKYWVLCVGNSVGRDFGPAVVSKNYKTPAELAGKSVAVGGHPTTGSGLALMFCPGIELVEFPFDAIVDAILNDEIDAGVMIHEELLYYEERGLNLVLDLGVAWNEDTGLPLPVGLNIVGKSLGMETARDVATACQDSLLWGVAHQEEVYAYANGFGRGRARDHVEMFRMEDFLRLPDDVRKAMRIMFDRVAAMGLGPEVESFEIVEGRLAPERLRVA